MRWLVLTTGLLAVAGCSSTDMSTNNNKDRKSELAKEIEPSTEPKDVMGYFKRANHMQSIGEYERAIRDYHKAIELHPDFVPAYGNLGMIYYDRGDLDKAEQMFARALEIEQELEHPKGIAKALTNLAAIYHARADFEKAEAMYRQALQINEKLGRQEEVGVGYANLGIMAQEAGDISRARELYAKARQMLARTGMTAEMQVWLDDLERGISDVR